jgi:8-oxo-dGTP pyrophosphatase MutT (NUDIX family)
MPRLLKRAAQQIRRAAEQLSLHQAGGIVFRRKREQLEVLLVTARRDHNRWVLPKGSLKRRESPRDAAVREVQEEAGVRGKIVARAGTAKYGSRRGLVRVDYYIMEFRRTADDAGEARRVEWCAVEDAISRLSYGSARRVLLEAYPRLREVARKRPRTA